jgi:hypothetical protein
MTKREIIKKEKISRIIELKMTMLARWRLHSHCMYAACGSSAEGAECRKSRICVIKDSALLVLRKEKRKNWKEKN